MQQRNENPLYGVSVSSSDNSVSYTKSNPSLKESGDSGGSADGKRSRMSCCNCITVALVALLASAALVIGLLAAADVLMLSGRSRYIFHTQQTT